MAEIDHFTYGPITPIFAYGLSVLGALLGLTCTSKARSTEATGRRAWYLLLAAWAIGGTGIWVMHFMAMLGFGVSGTEIRYDIPLTTVSAIIAITVVGIGLFVVGFGRVRLVKILLGGAFTGLGVAAMHYTGMAAMRLDGEVNYDRVLFAASVAIAVVAATVALWLAVTVRRPAAIIGSALVMGVAVTGMHYTGMYAMEVHLHDTSSPLTGATVFVLVLPILLLVLLVLVALISALLAAPDSEVRLTSSAPAAAAESRPVSAPPASQHPGYPNGPQANSHSVSLAEASGRRPPPTTPRRLDGNSFPSTRRQSVPRPTFPQPEPIPQRDPQPHSEH